jgi:hypothetical protein
VLSQSVTFEIHFHDINFTNFSPAHLTAEHPSSFVIATATFSTNLHQKLSSTHRSSTRLSSSESESELRPSLSGLKYEQTMRDSSQSTRTLRTLTPRIYRPHNHAVCTVQVFTNELTGPRLYFFALYYLQLGWHVIIFDRYGRHREYLQEFFRYTVAFHYHPFTILELILPQIYNESAALNEVCSFPLCSCFLPSPACLIGHLSEILFPA